MTTPTLPTLLTHIRTTLRTHGCYKRYCAQRTTLRTHNALLYKRAELLTFVGISPIVITAPVAPTTPVLVGAFGCACGFHFRCVRRRYCFDFTAPGFSSTVIPPVLSRIALAPVFCKLGHGMLRHATHGFCRFVFSAPSFFVVILRALSRTVPAPVFRRRGCSRCAHQQRTKHQRKEGQFSHHHLQQFVSVTSRFRPDMFFLRARG